MAGTGDDDAPLDASAELDEQIDALYAGPPEQFVAARTALAKALRQQKRRDEAAAVQRLARPAVVAWAAGRTVAGQPALWAALLEAGAALLAAQRRAVESADGRGVRPALLARREAVAALVASTRRWLDGEGRAVGDGRLDELSPLFETASVDDEVARALARGRLVRTPEHTTGFELLGGLEPASSPAGRPARPGPRPTAVTRLEVDDPDRTLDDAEVPDDADDGPDDPSALAAAAAAEQAAALAAARDAATDELDAAEERLRRATEAAEEADRRAAEGERAVEERRQALAVAERDAEANAAQRLVALAERDAATAARHEARQRLDAITAAPRSARRSAQPEGRPGPASG